MDSTRKSPVHTKRTQPFLTRFYNFLIFFLFLFVSIEGGAAVSFDDIHDKLNTMQLYTYGSTIPHLTPLQVSGAVLTPGEKNPEAEETRLIKNQIFQGNWWRNTPRPYAPEFEQKINTTATKVAELWRRNIDPLLKQLHSLNLSSVNRGLLTGDDLKIDGHWNGAVTGQEYDENSRKLYRAIASLSSSDIRNSTVTRQRMMTQAIFQALRLMETKTDAPVTSGDLEDVLLLYIVSQLQRLTRPEELGQFVDERINLFNLILLPPTDFLTDGYNDNTRKSWSDLLKPRSELRKRLLDKLKPYVEQSPGTTPNIIVIMGALFVGIAHLLFRSSDRRQPRIDRRQPHIERKLDSLGGQSAKRGTPSGPTRSVTGFGVRNTPSKTN